MFWRWTGRNIEQGLRDHGILGVTARFCGSMIMLLAVVIIFYLVGHIVLAYDFNSKDFRAIDGPAILGLILLAGLAVGCAICVFAVYYIGQAPKAVSPATRSVFPENPPPPPPPPPPGGAGYVDAGRPDVGQESHVGMGSAYPRPGLPAPQPHTVEGAIARSRDGRIARN